MNAIVVIIRATATAIPAMSADEGPRDAGAFDVGEPPMIEFVVLFNGAWIATICCVGFPSQLHCETEKLPRS